MKVIFNNIIPFPGFKAINLFGFVFARKGSVIDEKTLNHEAIHTAQIRELTFVSLIIGQFFAWETAAGVIINLVVMFCPFYLLYLLEWVIKLFFYKSKAYRNLSFEREAYQNEHDLSYLKTRKWFGFLRYL